ncbi:MAG: hypothetical protein HW421_3234 [Ignavibacteria bacterium]|nr:hypothetical protein [Ignavibacteria bacterium]
MQSDLEKFKKDLDRLIRKGTEIEFDFMLTTGLIPKDPKNPIYANIMKMQATTKYWSTFKTDYQNWYTESVVVIRNLITDRIDDFIRLFKDTKSKEGDASGNDISDALIDATLLNQSAEKKAKAGIVSHKLKQQIRILESAKLRFDSAFFEINRIMMAEFLDSEMENAKELLKRGFNRAAGIILGIILEKHLKQVVNNHKVNIAKSNPTPSDYNDVLRNREFIDMEMWKLVQHLIELRNLCFTYTDKECKQDDISELFLGVSKILKILS